MANWTTGAEMHPMAKATVGTGMIYVEVGNGYYEIYIDKKIQKSANNGETRCYTVEPGDHRVSAYSAGQMVLDETVHVPAKGEAVPEPEQPAESAQVPEDMPAEKPAAEEPTAEEPAQEPVEEPEPDQPDPDPVKPPEPYISIKVETVKLLIDEMRDLAGFLEDLLPSQKSEAEG